MKVTTHEITQWYHIVLHCDKCDAIMQYNGFDTKTMEYKSICPNCGNEVLTGNIGYPYTSYNFNLDPIKEEEI